MKLSGLLLLALALSMDASAVAMCKGACYRKPEMKVNLLMALSFGLFQAAMPLIGWLAGTQFTGNIAHIDHWVALVLLAGLGIKMIWEALHEEEELVCTPLTFRELMVMSIATSIDALAAGVALAMLEVNIYAAALVIGLVTVAMSFLGAMIGCKAGQKYSGKAQVLGGVVLCAIGVKVLLEHLMAAG